MRLTLVDEFELTVLQFWIWSLRGIIYFHLSNMNFCHHHENMAHIFLIGSQVVQEAWDIPSDMEPNHQINQFPTVLEVCGLNEMLLYITDLGMVYYTALLQLCYSSNKFEKKFKNPDNFLRNTFGQKRLKKK